MVKLFKKAINAYFRNVYYMYKPMIDCKVSPWL